MPKKVVVFGEMLWDCLPAGAVPGGAPMNVALNLHQLGLDSKLVSAVGNDQDGAGLLDFLKSFKLPLDLIQIKDHQATSKVLVDDRDKENIKYEIIAPVAWDFIVPSEEMHKEVADSDAFVFGSLGARNEVSFQTLMGLLPLAKLRIFDINLRPPFYDLKVIERLLQFTDIVKINEEELEELALYFGLKPEIDEVCEFLRVQFSIQKVCVTLGSKGALISSEGTSYRHQGYRVTVRDTIGAGDAFLSGFVYQYLNGATLEKTLDFSCKLGAYVASQKGGTPKYSLAELVKISFPKN